MTQITAASYCFYHTDTRTCVSKIHSHCNILTKYCQHWGIIYMFSGPSSLSGIPFRTEGVFVNVKSSWLGKGPLCSDKKHEIVLNFPVSLRTGGDPAGLLWVPINGVVLISISGCGCNYQRSCHFLLPSIRDMDKLPWKQSCADRTIVRVKGSAPLTGDPERKRHLFNRVLGIIESGFSGMWVLKLTDLVLRTTESSFSESDWVPVQFSTLTCTVFLQAGKRIDTGAQSRDWVNARAPWTLGPKHS